MRTSIQLRIEELLLDRIATELTARGASVFDRAAVQERIEHALDAPGTRRVGSSAGDRSGAGDRSSSSERSTSGNRSSSGVRSSSGDRTSSSGGVASAELELEIRIGHALGEGWNAAFEQAELGASAPPHVAILRGDRTLDARALETAVVRALERSEPQSALPSSTSHIPPAVFAIALGARAETLRAKLEGARVCGRDVIVHGGEKQSSEMELARVVEVVALSDSLDALVQALGTNRSSSSAGSPTTKRKRASSDTLVGTNLDGKFEILRRIGHGTFGAVYEARDLRLGNRVAIKVLHADETSPSDDLLAFKNEARRLTHLSHPHIVDWKSFEESSNGISYLVMELLGGEELESVLVREGKMEPKRAAKMLLQIADALRAAHFLSEGESILHLDLKPGNVFVLPSREGAEEPVKVIDFGIGQHVAGVAVPEATFHGGDSADHLGTLRALPRRTDGTVLAGSTRVQLSAACTPEYASPEQCAHMLSGIPVVPLDGRADLYSLGAIAFRMVTGRLPFEPGDDRYELLQTKCFHDAPSVLSCGVRIPRNLAAWIDRCLARDRDDRFRDLREAHDALARIVSPPLARRIVLPAAAAAIAIGATLWAVWPNSVPALDVRAEIDGADRDLSGTTLYFGPTHRSAELRLVGSSAVVKGDQPPAVRLVDGKGERTGEVEGWSARWIADDRIEVRAALGTERSSTTLYVEVARDQAPRTYSIPLAFVWLGADAWHLLGADVAGADSRALDPSGQSLRIRVQGSPDDLAWVGVERGEQRFKAAQSESSRDGDENIFLLPLDGLALSSGRAAISVAIDDRCGRSQRKTFNFDVQAEPLRFASVELDGLRIGERTVVSGTPKLRVALSASADVAWSIHSDAGEEIAHGSRAGVQRGEIPLADLRPADNQRAISGWIEVSADDAGHVARLRPAERGRASARLPFTYDPMPPDFDAHVVDAKTNDARTLDGQIAFVRDPHVTVRIVRKNVVPVRVEIAAVPVAQPGKACAQASSVMVDAARSAQDLALVLPSDGAYTIEVRARRHFPQGSDDRSLEFTKRGTVVVERRPPTLALEGADESIVIRSTNESPRKTRVDVAERSGVRADLEAPVALAWDLFRDAAPETPVAHGIAARNATSANPAELELPLPWQKDPPSRANAFDGKWTLRITGTDAAGNTAAPLDAHYEVGLDGPDLELVRPAPSTVWTRNASGRFEIEVHARDPNGVADLACSLHRRGTDEARAIVLERTASAATAIANADTTWKGEVTLPTSWSHAELAIDLAATDGARSRSRLLHACSLPMIELALPPRIAAVVDEKSTCPMRLVRGNHDRDYVFGGRVDAEEDEAFRAAGLGMYNPFSTPKSWQAVCAPGEIGDYYLDEREVSAAEMLAFVSSPAWDDPQAWPANEAPPPARRYEITAHLRASNPDAPATDVTWDEAAAYARWTGKRLQSWLEWEYALRGGSRYRPWAGWTEKLASPPSGGINHDDDNPSRGAWSSNRGGDVTSDTGIAHLSDNVAEWTSTAVGSERCNASRPTHVVASLPGSARDLYWVAGGSFDLQRFDFSVADRRGKHWHGASVGFRCALTATEMSKPDGDAAQRTRFRAIDAPEDAPKDAADRSSASRDEASIRSDGLHDEHERSAAVRR